jgi:hypothetical protein
MKIKDPMLIYVEDMIRNAIFAMRSEYPKMALDEMLHSLYASATTKEGIALPVRVLMVQAADNIKAEFEEILK